ncbi:unnamed protein product [Allacma fusca]|uniref:Cytochrome P450 n=1 Tax=Allacma fusca TaxID=39272 RepID=A0A8J2JRX6_9HEXA|nr:unnamed protein product [Allacma fusca]
MRQFSGPRMFPLIGNTWYLVKPEDRLTNLTNAYRSYGSRVAFSAGHLKGLLLVHPDDVGKILSSREMNKSSLYDLIFKDWLGSSIFYAKGKKYFEMRKTLSPAFEFKQIYTFERYFNEQAKNLVNILKQHETDGQVTEIRWLFALCAYDIILQYVTGKSMGFLKRGDSTYAAAVHNELKLVFKRGWQPWLWPNWTWRISPLGREENANRKLLQSFMNQIFEDRKAEMTSAGFNLHDKLNFLDLLIGEQLRGVHEITDDYIREETSGAIFAGHDTVASTLTFTTFLMASNPDEQAKLHQELDEVFGEDRERDVESSDRPKLKYLECCIKEAMRLYPPAPFLIRAPEPGFKLDENTTIPEGVEVMLSGWVTQRLPEFFPDPDEFRPSRFFPENCIGRHPYCYFPFSAGPRNCMAQKIALANVKTILAHIFRNFTVELVSPVETVIPVGELVMFPKNGLQIKLRSR